MTFPVDLFLNAFQKRDEGMDMDMDMSMPDNSNNSTSNSDSSTKTHDIVLNFHFFLVLHLVTFFVAFGLVYPYAFACKQAKRTKRHILFVTLGLALTVVGFISGHLTGIDHYNSWFSDIGAIFCWAITAGSYFLLVYVDNPFLSHLRRGLNVLHTSLSTIQPLVCWVTTGLSIISLMRFCGSEGDHTGQCLAHGIMGTAFVTYGVILFAMMYFGEQFLVRHNRSQEYLDSWVITIWGIVNTFTEHRWGKPWNHKDVQHTSMGIIWWALGMFGIYTTWDRVNNKPKRSHVPALIILATGYSMLSHSQSIKVSSKVHFMFGVVLMLTALVRIIEISFVLNDEPADNSNIRVWQFLTPLLLVECGMLFMSATEQSMEFLTRHGIMAAPYILIISSVASFVALAVLIPIQSYVRMRNENKVQLAYKEGTDDIEMPFLAEPTEDTDSFNVDE